ncbi:V-type ATP synthase subunit I [Sporanaerobacter sp. PP17-6a]|uniref:V-type ATP synthase subunit I n=1 Tax=Sporanaerobacter sp. PP17-6a TaxID=1891289 RepID=UPI00089FD79C|nr:V-type ATP synthase subunit I [Sporanaerobacter sp. PP17-6a]SCL90634.1 V-type ATP synthase subunit I [Sporanaerobacter sp. PP17-6a]
MAIVKMKKIIIAAPEEDKASVLSSIQSKNCIEIVDLKSNVGIEELDYSKGGNTVSQKEIDLNNIKFTYDFLKQYNKEKHGILDKKEILTEKEFKELGRFLKWKNVYLQCKEIREKLESDKNEISKLSSLAEQYVPWTNLDVKEEELRNLTRISYFWGSVSKKFESQMYDDLKTEFTDIYIEKISEKGQNINLLLLGYIDDKKDISEILKKYGFAYNNMDFSDTPKNKIKKLNEDIRRLKNEHENMKIRAEKLSENIKYIEKVYDYFTSELDKEKILSKLLETKKTFMLEGWTPADKSEEIKSFLKSKYEYIYIELKDVSEGDNPPIKLKNNFLVEPFEIITSLYALPVFTEIDPTPVITPFYMVFFGMMMADIGYGLVMIAASLFMLKFMDMEEGMKKIVKLIFYCGFPTILFGFLYGSFFGGIIDLKPLWVSPVANTMDVLVVSLIMGIIHIFAGLGVKAYMLIRDKKYKDAFYDVFAWYGLIIGLICIFLKVGGNFSKILSGVSALVLLLTQGRDNKSIVGKFFGGLYGLYGITGYLGDTLSYSRLLALGLSSGLIGWAFNILVEMVGGKGFISMIFAVLIFIAGHTFNLLIGGLGTFVHTCRLQYLEFFGKFYEGGGKAFEPLRFNTKYIRIKTE